MLTSMLTSVVTFKFLYSHARPEPVEERVIWALRLCSGQDSTS